MCERVAKRGRYKIKSERERERKFNGDLLNTL